MAGSLLLSALLVIGPLLCRAAFNNSSDPLWCLSSSCVENDGGRVCFKPTTENLIRKNTCDGSLGDDHGHDPAFQVVMDAHIYHSHGYSIAYYDYSTNELLGDFTYPVPPNTTVKLCLSGRTIDDDGYQTWCMQTDKDNDINIIGPYCWSLLGQTSVSDNCYIAMPTSTGVSSVSSSSGILSNSFTPVSAIVVTVLLVILGLAFY